MLANISGVVPGASDFWPGKTSYLIFFSGCNFNCPACDSVSVVKFHRSNDRDLKDLKKDILLGISSIDSIIVTGGEPTMNRLALLDLARFARSNGLAFGIETNGSKPAALKSLLEEGLLDFIAFDLKSALEPERFEKATKSKTFFIMTEQVIKDIKESLELLRKYQDKLSIEFRTTVTPTIAFRKEDLLDIASIIAEFRRSSWVLQRFSQANVQHKMLREILPPSYTFMTTLSEAIKKAFPQIILEIRDRRCYTFPEPVELDDDPE